jgi:hypothetical protein
MSRQGCRVVWSRLSAFPVFQWVGLYSTRPDSIRSVHPHLYSRSYWVLSFCCVHTWCHTALGIVSIYLNDTMWILYILLTYFNSIACFEVIRFWKTSVWNYGMELYNAIIWQLPKSLSVAHAAVRRRLRQLGLCRFWLIGEWTNYEPVA